MQRPKLQNALALVPGAAPEAEQDGLHRQRVLLEPPVPAALLREVRLELLGLLPSLVQRLDEVLDLRS